MKEALFLGVGRTDITPEIGCKLAGYEPKRRSESIHDRLNMIAFYFRQGETAALLASGDLCNIPDETSIMLRKAMAEAAGVPFDNIILCTTHDHSGPVTFMDADYKDTDLNYVMNTLLPQTAEAARQAAAAPAEVELGVAEIESEVGINRREIRETGGIKLGQEPLGLMDKTMTVIAFRDREKNCIANLVHYNAHNTGAGKNPEITRDWAGVMKDRLEQQTGGVTMFVNGCEGNCGPRLANGKTTGDLQLALELGGSAAIDACMGWRNIREWRKDCELRVTKEDIVLPMMKLPSAAELKERIRQLGDPETLEGLNKNSYIGLNWQLDLVERGVEVEKEKAFPTVVIAVGPLAIVPCVQEMFSNMTMRIRRYSPYPYTLCISHANGRYGYFPTLDQIPLGGYEVTTPRSRKSIPIADEADQAFLEGALRILRDLKK